MADQDSPPAHSPAPVPPSAPPAPKPPPPPIHWETETSTRSQEPSTLGTAALEVVRKVIHGDASDG